MNQAAAGKAGDDLIGQPAPEWNLDQWLNSEPLSLSTLKGKVVLVRWWTNYCQYCSKSAQALNEFHEKYKDQGLTVVGMYHPKPRPMTTNLREVKSTMRALGFKFPIAIDDDWGLLNKYWLDKQKRGFTSVSFLIDKKGIIRYVHPGPEFHSDGNNETHAKCKKDYAEIKNTIEDLLKE